MDAFKNQENRALLLIPFFFLASSESFHESKKKQDLGIVKKKNTKL